MFNRNEDAACGTGTGGLAVRHCEPCRGGVPALAPETLSHLERQLAAGWRVVGAHHLEKRYTFPDFRGAMAFAVHVGEVAEAEGHHPSLHVSWGMTRVEIWTLAIDGLTENDFILAARIDEVCS